MTDLPPSTPKKLEGETARPAADPEPEPRRKRGFPWALLLIILIICGAGVALYLNPALITYAKSLLPAPATPTDRGRSHGPLPVVVAKAEKGSLKVYLTGLGSVTPNFSVTVKTRVSGQLMSVGFEEGQAVKKGDTIADIDPRPYQVQLEQYEAQLVHDQAVLDNAKTDLQRYQTLWNQQSIAQQTLATQQATVLQDQGTVQGDQALIDSVKLNLVYCHITSPQDGVVGLRSVDPGNYVQPSDSNGLAVINQIEPITVIFTVPEDQIAPLIKSLKDGQHLPVTAFDRSFSKELSEGTLLTSDNQIDASTGTLRFRASFPNTDHSLFPNQFVNARILVDTKTEILLVPSAAIQHGQQGSFVYTVSDESTVAMKPVTTGVTDGQQTEILSGINPGDTVITDGVDKLQEGAQVIPTLPNSTPATSPDSSATPDASGQHHHHHQKPGDPSPSQTPAS